MTIEQEEPSENQEIINWCINETGWPFEPSRYSTIKEVAKELKAALFDRRENPDIEESFRIHGYEWPMVNWEMLAVSMMADVFGDDWSKED